MRPKPHKITIFWYPKASRKLQSKSKASKRHSKVAAKQHSRKVASQQLSSQAGESYVFMMPKPPKIAIFWYPKGGKPAAK